MKKRNVEKNMLVENIKLTQLWVGAYGLLHRMLKNKCRSTVLNLGGVVAQALSLQ